jgi:SulP family sulfate permease
MTALPDPGLAVPRPRFRDLFVPKLVTVLREGYGLEGLRADALAGLTVAIVALPLSMAIAIASGVGPERGLYTAIVGGFLVSALGGSRFQIGGPAGAFIVLVASTVLREGVDGLILAAFLSGLMLLAAGFLRLGSYIKLIPYPVTVGFTAGIGIIILASQLKELLGLTLAGPEPAAFVPKVAALGAALPTLNPAAVGVAIGTVAIIVLLRRWRPGWPAFLIAVAGAALAAWAAGLPVATIGTRFGGIPSTLPAPALPDFSRTLDLLPDAFAFTLLGAIESLLSAVVADGMTGRRHRSNCELVAQGVANMGSSLFGGICVTGTIARTATNVRAGARGPVAGMLHSAFLLGFMALAAPLAAYIPLAALAGVLLIVSWGMIERQAIGAIFRVSRGDALVLSATLLLTIFRDLTEGIIVGFALGAFLFIDRMSRAVSVQEGKPDLRRDVADDAPRPFTPDSGVDPDLVVYRVTGAFFFGAAARIEGVLDRIADRRRSFVLDLSALALLDSTAAKLIVATVARAERDGIRVVIAGAAPQVRAMLAAHADGTPLVHAPSAADAVALLHAPCTRPGRVDTTPAPR